jgi:hypothetical protein
MPLITIGTVPPSATGGMLVGRIDLSGFSPNAHRQIRILTFRWTNFAVSDWPVGWKPGAPWSARVTPEGAWKIRVGPGVQYAAMWVKSRRKVELTGEEPPAAGTLPLGLCGDDSQNYHIKASIDVAVLSGPGELLSGLVTGRPSAWEDPTRLTREAIPHEHELLKVVAWAQEGNATRCVGVRRCDPSGYWAFPAFDWRGRRAERHAVALTEDSFVPSHTVPPVDRPVLALVWTRRPPLTQTAGSGP